MLAPCVKSSLYVERSLRIYAVITISSPTEATVIFLNTSELKNTEIILCSLSVPFMPQDTLTRHIFKHGELGETECIHSSQKKRNNREERAHMWRRISDRSRCLVSKKYILKGSTQPGGNETVHRCHLILKPLTDRR